MVYRVDTKYGYRYTLVDRRAHELLAGPLLFVPRTVSQRGTTDNNTPKAFLKSISAE
jgi:hypothetical protein